MCAATVAVVAAPGSAGHLAPQIVETNAAEVVSTGAVATETACPGGWSGGSAQYLFDETAHLAWTFTVPADHTGVVSVVGYRDPALDRSFFFWVDSDPQVLVANEAGTQECRATLAASGALPAGTHTVHVAGTAASPDAYLDYFQLVTASITGDVVITKVSDTPGTFDFTVDCPTAGVVARPVQIVVAAAGPPGTAGAAVTGIPVGTACTVTEATTPGFAPQPPQDVTVAEGTNAVTFTNVRETGALVVSKTTEGGTGTFTFTVDCNPGTAFDSTFTLAGGESRRIEGIPTLTTCSVTEAPDSAFTATSTPADGTVTIGTGDNPVSFVNTARPPVLTVTKTADAATVSAGAAVGFTVTVANTGAGPARAVVLTDPLPAADGVSWVIAPAGPGPCTVTGAAPSQTLGCAFGDLAAGASASVHVVSATTAATGGTLANTATASAANAAPVTASASVTVNRPALAVTKAADAGTVTAGGAVGFTVAVSNAGPGTATGVTLDDPLPAAAGVAWSVAPAYGGPGTCAVTGAAPAQSLACSFGDLAPGASASVHVTSATPATAAAVLANTATARAANAAAVSATASVTLVLPAPPAGTAGTQAASVASTAATGGSTAVSGSTAAATTGATSTATTASTAGSVTGGSDVAGEDLARTGADVAALTTAGLLLLLGGAVLLDASRHRRRKA